MFCQIEMIKMLMTVIPVIILLIGVFPGQSAGITCYNCSYNRGDSDDNCVTNPTQTSQVECDGHCSTSHVFSAVDNVTQRLERGCLNNRNGTGCFNDTLGSFPFCLMGCCPSLCNSDSRFPLPEQETDCPLSTAESLTTRETGGSGGLRASLLMVSSLEVHFVLHSLHWFSLH